MISRALQLDNGEMMKFDEIKELCHESQNEMKSHILSLTMPPWALGDLLDNAVKLAGIQRTKNINIDKKNIFIFASDHGVVEEGVSAFPQEVTTQMMYNFASAGAAISVLAKQAKANTLVIDMGVNGDLSELESSNSIISHKIAKGTKNFSKGEAMTSEQAQKCLDVGINLANEYSNSTDIFAIGEMGIGNTTSATAIAAALLDKGLEEITGHGTGINDETKKKKISIIEKSLKLHKDNLNDPIGILRCIGGFEIAAMTGLVLGAAQLGKPIVIDGVIATAAALLAFKIDPNVSNYLFASHKSVEPAHQYMLDLMDLRPMLDLNLRLGEGSGTPLAMNLLESSVCIVNEMATFESAAVSNKTS